MAKGRNACSAETGNLQMNKWRNRILSSGKLIEEPRWIYKEWWCKSACMRNVSMTKSQRGSLGTKYTVSSSGSVKIGLEPFWNLGPTLMGPFWHLSQCAAVPNQSLSNPIKRFSNFLEENLLREFFGRGVEKAATQSPGPSQCQAGAFFQQNLPYAGIWREWRALQSTLEGFPKTYRKWKLKLWPVSLLWLWNWEWVFFDFLQTLQSALVSPR